MDLAELSSPSRKRRRNPSTRSQSRKIAAASTLITSGSAASTGKSTRALPTSKRLNPKANTACETCRLKKVKCNEGHPICNYCDTHGFRCDYRLRPVSSNEQAMSTLLKRLALLEEKLENATYHEGISKTSQTKATTMVVTSDTPIVSSSSLRSPYSPSMLPVDQLWFNHLPESFSIPDRAAYSYKTPVSFSDESTVEKRHPDKTPFTCEEDRPPLSEFIGHKDPINISDMMPWLEYYLEHVSPLYPVMCDLSAQTICGLVAAQGFGDDIESCFSLLIVALAKAHMNKEVAESGTSDFKHATQILSRVGLQFKTRYAQVHVLSAVFLLKKGRLLEFWNSLHTGCTTLYTMLRKDEVAHVERSMSDTMNVKRIYWICLNFEREIQNEIDDTLPRSSLHELAHTLPLPLGCDELNLSHLPRRLHTMLTFFLAEMSLKAIADGILKTTDLEFYIHDPITGSTDLSPLFQQLKRQLDEWTESVPSFLDWSSKPTKGLRSPLGTRLKLLYWFVRFSLFRPLIKRVLSDSGSLFPILVWNLFREGLHTGLTLINVAISEKSDIGVIMGNRVLSTICLLKETVAKGYYPATPDEDVGVVLQAGIDMLWSELAGKSEWIKCKLYSQLPTSLPQTV